MNLNRYSYLDIIIILTIVFIALVIKIPNLVFNSTINDIFTTLFLFILGYATLITVYPQNNKGKLKKFIYSIFIGVGYLILILILENAFPKSMIIIKENLIIFLALITLIFITAAYIQRKSLEVAAPNFIVCDKCKSYYPLQEGESLESFEKCKCGGSLSYGDPSLKKELIVPGIITQKV